MSVPHALVLLSVYAAVAPYGYPPRRYYGSPMYGGYQHRSFRRMGEAWFTVGGTILPGDEDHPGIARGKPASCPGNGYIIGFRTKSEKHQGKYDDSALNAVEFECSDGSAIKSTEGPWGGWSPWQQCPDNLFFTGIRLRVEMKDEEGTDYNDAAGAISVKMMCNDETEIEAIGARNFGHWGRYPTACDHQHQHICGFASYVQAKQGDGDDLGMTGMDIRCCKN